MVDWRHNQEQKWDTLRLGDVKVETHGDHVVFEVDVFLKDLDPNSVRVELYANGVKGSAPVQQEMTLLRPPSGATGSYVYSASVSAARAPTDYTARVIPHFDGAAIPLEDARILWQR
jgi:starch phosphorylase